MHNHHRGVIAIAGVLAALAWPAAARAAAGGVKRLYGFELAEIVGDRPTDPAKGREWRFVGKPWTGGEPAPGWRVREHAAELKLPADHDGPVTVYRPDGSRDRPLMTLYRKGATQGRYARACGPDVGGGRIIGWNYISAYARRRFRGLTAEPAHRSYHDVQDWFYQRYTNVFDDALEHRHARRDWSAYARLRVDVFSDAAPAVVALRAFDASGPDIRAQRLGLRTALAVFRIPNGRQVTVDFPLADLARAAEMDLSKMMGFVIRLNGFEGETTLFYDNIRLVAEAAAASDARHPIVRMAGPVRPYDRPVVYRPVPRDAAKSKRRAGPVEPVGPVTVYEGTRTYSSARMLLGGSGATYFQSFRRACVACDNDRLLVLFGQYLAMASFDGGRTWGGIQPGAKGPTALGWGGEYRGTACGDRSDLYFLGTENCSSYHEGSGVLFRRLAMTGPGWQDDRVSLVSQNLRKCPPDLRAWRLGSGRIWAAWTDGWGGCLAKCSDDDGYTWAPCKDASLAAPRPFHRPGLKDLLKPPARRPRPPKAVLLWPATPVCGSVIVPYRGRIAVLGPRAEWQHYDGRAWSAPRKLPWRVPYSAAATALGERLFLVRGATYRDAAKAPAAGSLQAAVLTGNNWKTTTLEQRDVGDAIVSASGDAVFCFYVRYLGDPRRHHVMYSRWHGGAWSPPRTVAAENIRINRLAAPVVSAPDYAAVWWDEWRKARREPLKLRFALVPNGP